MNAVPLNLRVVLPEGWTLELMDRMPDHALLTTPQTGRCYYATLDFRARGIRSGSSVSGPFISQAWNTPRKKYRGRGWRQELVDDAVAHLQEVLR